MSAALAVSPDSPFLFPDGCQMETPKRILALAQEALRKVDPFCGRLPLAPMPVAHVGRLRRWVETQRPDSLHPLCLDPSAEKDVVRLFAKHGLYVEIALSKARDLPTSYELVLLT